VFFRSKPTAWLIALSLLQSFQGTAQQGDSSSEEEKKRRFLKAREEMQPAPATPARPSTPTPAKPKPKAYPGNTPPKKPTPPPTPSPKPAQPSPAKTAPQQQPPAATPVVRPPAASPVVRPPSKPAPPTPPPAEPTASTQDAPVVIEKSSVEQRAPVQTAPRSSFFGWFNRWKYLSRSTRDEIDRAPVEKGRWRYLVVHNSGTRQGNAKAFDYYHTQVRKMPNGLAYQFVIGNGTSSADGQIEIGPRWKRQINGGHVHSDYLNNIALGICLVGDFNQEQPTVKQLEALDELVRYLRQRVGKTEGKWAVVKAHREINPPRWPTDCPGDEFPYRWLHNRFD
jgi:hypothetical protein